jgi:ER membrane protein complex subunit 1
MRFYAQVLLTLLLVQQVSAVFQDEAFHVDYQYALLGSPKPDSSFFHRPQASSSASLLYTLSEKLVLGAVNPKDGSIVWRHDLSKSAPSKISPGFLRAKSGENTVVSGIGHHVSAWDALDGKLIWDTQFGDDEVITDLEIVDGGSDVPAVAVLLSGARGAVKTLDLKSGEVNGQYTDDR